jgi:hypothetical protein
VLKLQGELPWRRVPPHRRTLQPEPSVRHCRSNRGPLLEANVREPALQTACRPHADIVQTARIQSSHSLVRLTSAPLMTTIIDSTGLLIYFYVAQSYLAIVGHVVDAHHTPVIAMNIDCLAVPKEATSRVE